MRQRFNHLPDIFQRACRYSLTGVLITLLHFSIAVFIIEKLGLTPTIANGIASLIAMLVSFVINSVWSFKQPLQGPALVRFFIVSLIGFLLTVGIAWVNQLLGFHYIMGIMLVIIIIPLITFTLHNSWTYKTIPNSYY